MSHLIYEFVNKSVNADCTNDFQLHVSWIGEDEMIFVKICELLTPDSNRQLCRWNFVFRLL